MGIWMSVVATIFVLLIFLLWKKKSREHLYKEFPDLLWTAFFTLVATFWGVFVAFRLEHAMSQRLEERIFERSLTGIEEEVINNQSKVDLLKGDTVDNFIPFHIDVNLENTIMTNPLLYKYTGPEYWTTLEGCIGVVDIVNNIQDSLFEKIKSGAFPPGGLNLLRNSLNLLNYDLNLLLMQTLSYLDSMPENKGVSAGNSKEIMDFLNQNGDKDKNLKIILDRIDKYKNPTKDELKKLQRTYQKIFQDE